MFEEELQLDSIETALYADCTGEITIAVLLGQVQVQEGQGMTLQQRSEEHIISHIHG